MVRLATGGRCAVAAEWELPWFGDFRFHDTSNIRAVVGVVLVLLAMFLAGPIGLFLVAAIWSALFGWLLADDAEGRAGAAEGQPSGS